ncbi:tol-pal system protein YbgF [Chelatococcus reniformis]|uniref:Cell division coordinator CpoB n=1 Tax=Chelatococcus reniformis TaxID=1494448 RepID=A0A916U9P7_9HYPH|nr:tol-pal system protein YbgF [Chelatococcus reniformis]GGC64562.1 tol-pal system protein YbgF [Chelatococcus reniformis]
MTVLRPLVRNIAAVLALAAFAFPALAQDPGDMIVRIGRLENQLRQMAGQIEQLQFENRRLTEQLRKFQEDVEFRFQDKPGGGAGARSAPQQSPPSASQQPPRGSQRRGDAFDPSRSPGAPGAPQPLGSPRSAAPPLAPDGVPGVPQGAIATGGVQIIDDQDGDTRVAAADPEAPMDDSGAPPPPRGGTSIASTGNPASPRADYDAAFSDMSERHYDQAEMGFRRYLQSHPRDRLVPDATYWLGESYYQRGRYREAAEQFLKVSTDFGGSGKAPDSLVKLGMSLNRIGAHDQACATYGEVIRRYPQASAEVRSAIDRERRRTKC